MARLQLFLGVCLIWAATAFGQDSLGIRRLGELTYWDGVRDVQTADGYAYVPMEWSGLHVVNVRTMQEVGTCREAEGGLVRLAGSLACVLDRYNGLHIVDISDPTHPQHRSYFSGLVDSSALTASQSMAAEPGYAYICKGADSVWMISLADPGAPFIAGSYGTMPEPVVYGVQNRHLFILSMTELEIVDVSDPIAPAQLSVMTLPEMVSDVSVDGNLLCYVSNMQDVSVVDISNPASPQPRGTFVAGNGVYWITVQGARAFAHSFDQVFVLDLADPAAPVLIGGGATGLAASAAAVSGNSLLFGAAERGLISVDITNPAEPQLADSCGDVADLRGIAKQDSYLYAACYWKGVRVISLVDPAAPQEVARIGDMEHAYDVAVAGGYLYAVTEDQNSSVAELRVYSLANPAAPQEVSRLTLNGGATCLTVSGNYVYLGSMQNVRVVDVSDPLQPLLRGTFQQGTRMMLIWDLAEHDGALYAVTYLGTLFIIDVHDPDQLQLYTAYEDNFGAVSVALEGFYAYAGTPFEGISVLEIGQPWVPTLVNSIPSQGAQQLRVRDGFLFAAVAREGLNVYNVSDTEHIQRTGYYHTPLQCMDLLVTGNDAYIAEVTGIQILNCAGAAAADPEIKPSAPAQFGLGEAYPNPFNPVTTLTFTVPRATHVTLKIFDLTGREAATLTDAQYNAGTYRISFDGSGLASGVYFAQLSAGGLLETRRLILLK